MSSVAARSPILAALAEPERHRLMARAVPRTFAAGEVLHLAGEVRPSVSLVVFGVVKLVGRDVGGGEVVVGLVAPGELVGEDVALDRRPPPLEAVAATRVRLDCLDADLFTELVSSTPAAAIALARVLARRSRLAYEAALDRAGKPAPARLAGRLLQLAELLGEPRGEAIEVELPMSQADLGSLSGMCRESVCKSLRSLRERGLVDYRGRKVRILRPDALERISCARRA
jgi:CRP-like cAMP-binding protein